VGISVSTSDGDLLGKPVANYLPSWGKLLHRSPMSPVHGWGGHRGVQVLAGTKLRPHPASGRRWHGLRMREKREEDPIKVKTHLSAPWRGGGWQRWLRELSDHLMDVGGGDEQPSPPPPQIAAGGK